jgi:hypothetical protein
MCSHRPCFLHTAAIAGMSSNAHDDVVPAMPPRPGVRVRVRACVPECVRDGRARACRADHSHRHQPLSEIRFNSRSDRYRLRQVGFRLGVITMIRW